MTDARDTPARTWQYRFSDTDGNEFETGAFTDDDAALARAEDLSRTRNIPVVIHRLRGHVDWQYVTEADERP